MIAEELKPALPLLLVDDTPQNLRLASFLLKSEGLEVRTAESAEEALELLANERFSLALVDIQLPGMDGLELTRRIRDTPAWADLPVVALTAYAMRDDKERMLAAGCDGYISKPIDTRSFPQQVMEHLNLRSAASDSVMGPEIDTLRSEFLTQTRAQVHALLSLEDTALGGPDTFQALHRWAGFAGSVGLGPLTLLAQGARQFSLEPPAVRASRLRPVLTSILGLIESL
jgi:CheY-like chemotaxis protein